MSTDVFKPLSDELDLWNWSGTPASLWWRDDDAAESSLELDKLINLTEAHKAPCGLAVVPAKTGESLRKFLSGTGYIWILQHGYAHVNHAPKDSGAWELGLHRPKDVVLEELREGMGKLRQLFKDSFVPVVVPPWNNIDPALYDYLPGLGFRGVSAEYQRKRPTPPEGLRMADAHCDLLDWKDKENGAKFAGAEKCVKLITKHLKAKRKGLAVPAEPTCVLSHHLDMDDAAWAFLETLLSFISEHPAAQWVSPADIWPAT